MSELTLLPKKAVADFIVIRAGALKASLRQYEPVEIREILIAVKTID